jgi:hypothetical protein
MRQLKPVIQDAADRINDPMIDDDVQAIKDIVVIERKVKEAIQAHKAQEEELTTAHEDNQNTIVTGEDIRNEMNRKIRDEGYLR